MTPPPPPPPLPSPAAQEMAGAGPVVVAPLPMTPAHSLPVQQVVDAPSDEFLARIDHEFARRHLVLSGGVYRKDGAPCETLLVAERTNPLVAFNVGVRLGRRVHTQVRDAEELAASIDAAYELAKQRAQRDADGGLPRGEDAVISVEGSADLETDLDAAVRAAEGDVLNTQGKAPSVRLVDLILFEALRHGASDVHVQPMRDRTLVRYRADGTLRTVRELPASLASAVTTRIKVMARLDVAERRTPQDGRAAITVGLAKGSSSTRRVDLRVSTIPSTFGERVVLRLLDPSRSSHLLSFESLGMPKEIERRYLEQASRTSGIVLSTGPTGSGKTTTLYATLAWVSESNAGRSAHGCELNIMTVEDPVEYDLSGESGSGHNVGRGLAVSQTQVDPKKGVTFAAGLRHILRQDPDVIMVGEIRDEETARIAVQASLTGHLVLSTLHTNDAASAVARLLDLGIEPFLVSSSLLAVLAQRLVRRTHAACCGRGCEGCLESGYKGRLGVFELLVMDAELRELVTERASASVIKDVAQRKGMVSLRDAGATLVRSGVTSRAEITRAIEAVEEEL